MSLQIIQGGNGKPTGVFIPMNDWEAMKTQFENLEMWEETTPSKEDILSNIKRGFEEMKLIKKGKLKTTSLNDFLNEL